MTFKNNISAAQIEELIEHLPQRERVRMIRKITQKDIELRWKNILQKIDSRLKKFPISRQDVLNEITTYRREKNVKGRH